MLLDIANDNEWGKDGKLSVLGLAWDKGHKASAYSASPERMRQMIGVFERSDNIAMHNGHAADLRQLAAEGISIETFQHKVFDTMLGMHVIAGHLAGIGSYDLRSCVLLLNVQQGERFPLDFKQYEADIFETCRMDAAACLWISREQRRRIRMYGLEKTNDISHKSAPIFALMRERGVRLDRNVLGTIQQEQRQKQERLVAEFGLTVERGKKKIKQVPIWRSDAVLDRFEQSFGVRPRNRQRATWDVLAKDQRLSQQARDFAEAIVMLSQGANNAHWLGKVTQTDKGFDFSKVDAAGFIYPDYNITGSPDRPIATEPNIQNFPRPKDDPRAVPLRSAVIPYDKSHVMLSVDMSSVETYTNAIESSDWDRVQAIRDKRLSHENTAALMNSTFGLVLTRQDGKILNHAWDKGESPFAAASRLFKVARASPAQARLVAQIFDSFLAAYPKTAEFRITLWERAQQNPLVVQNAFGRRLECFSRGRYGDASEYFAKHDHGKKYWCSCRACAPRRERWKYALAFLGRSSAVDVLLRVMCRIWNELRLDDYSLPTLEVHDELDFSVPSVKAEHYARAAVECFEEPVPELGGIRLPAEAKLGRNWAEAH